MSYENDGASTIGQHRMLCKTRTDIVQKTAFVSAAG